MRFPLDRNLLYDSSLGEELLLFERHNSQSREFIITFPFTGKTIRQLNNSRKQLCLIHVIYENDGIVAGNVGVSTINP